MTAVVRRAHSLPSAVTEAARDGRLRLLPGRLEDGEALARALQGAKTVIHLATGSGDSSSGTSKTSKSGAASKPPARSSD